MPAPMNNANGRKWAGEHNAMLTDCMLDGATFSQAATEINDRFGTSYTRCAVAGRAKRLGLKSANGPHPRVGAVQAWTAGRAKAAEARRKPRSLSAAAPAAPIPKFHPDNLSGLRCAKSPPTIWATFGERTGCRWPYGDRGYVFCDLPEIAGCPYCRWHMAIAQGAGTASERAAHRTATVV
jgi:GcrA cell cycle regulator